MYAIRYRKTNTRREYVRILASWDEAIDTWAHLMGEPLIRILPNEDTGLDIELLAHGRQVKDMPYSYRLLCSN